MTVIAWDGKTLAADRLLLRGGTKTYGTKIFKIGNNFYGFAGNSDSCRQVQAYFQRLADGGDADWPDCQKSEDYCIVLEIETRLWNDADQDCTTKVFKHAKVYDKYPLGKLVEGGYHAIGSGDALALAAMHTGASAEQAVLAAIHHADGCGGTVDTLTL
jgi:hypothetical protein